MTAYAWAALIAAWLAGTCWFAPTLRHWLARNDTPTQEPPAPQRPSPTAAVPGPRLPSLAPPAPSLDWVTDERLLQARCGCIHILDHVKRTRQRIPCEIHAFDVDEWERRLQL